MPAVSRDLVPELAIRQRFQRVIPRQQHAIVHKQQPAVTRIDPPRLLLAPLRPLRRLLADTHGSSADQVFPLSEEKPHSTESSVIALVCTRR